MGFKLDKLEGDESMKIQCGAIGFAVCLLILLGCTSSSTSGGNQTPAPSNTCNSIPVAKGARQFGMDILDVPTTGGYASNLTGLKALGGQFQTLHVSWRDIEASGSGTTSGAFTDPSNAFAALDALAISDGIKVTLRIHPVDVPGKSVPSDLANFRFNSATLQTRAKAMIDYVFTRISPANITHLVMGNEIDGYDPGSDSNFWLDYADFLFNMNAYLNTNYPTVQLGFVITMRGATDSSYILPSSGSQKAVDIFSAWTGTVDFLGITYYPLESTFQLKANSLVAGTFQTLVAFTTVPIHIEEVGYSTSATNGGSEDLQSEFFCNVFTAWDLHSSRIPSLAILRMVDKTRSDAESVAITYGLSGNEAFIEFIRSLGIKSSAGTGKSSFSLIQSELKKRGF
jgi:hypothetical protein